MEFQRSSHWEFEPPSGAAENLLETKNEMLGLNFSMQMQPQSTETI